MSKMPPVSKCVCSRSSTQIKIHGIDYFIKCNYCRRCSDLFVLKEKAINNWNNVVVKQTRGLLSIRFWATVALIFLSLSILCLGFISYEVYTFKKSIEEKIEKVSEFSKEQSEKIHNLTDKLKIDTSKINRKDLPKLLDFFKEKVKHKNIEE